MLSAADIEELIALARDTVPDLVVIERASSMAAALAVAREVREADRHVPLLLAVCACASAAGSSAQQAIVAAYRRRVGVSTVTRRP